MLEDREGHTCPPHCGPVRRSGEDECVESLTGWDLGRIKIGIEGDEEEQPVGVWRVFCEDYQTMEVGMRALGS